MRISKLEQGGKNRQRWRKVRANKWEHGKLEQWWWNENGGNEDETCDEIGDTGGCKVQALEASKQGTCIVEGRRNSRKNKSTPSIQNDKTPKQPQKKKKPTFKRAFKKA